MSNLTNIKDSSNIISCLEQSEQSLLYEEEAENVEKTFYWYQKAADNGNDVAMYNLAICYENNEGTAYLQLWARPSGSQLIVRP